MKAICMPQPWASMLCAGLQDVLSMAWKPERNPGRILIVATDTQVPQDYHSILPSAWAFRMDNFLTMGQLPALDQLPQQSIVGYVDISDFSADEVSIWSLPECWSWQLSEAHTFAEPIPYTEGKQYVFDINEISPDSLPATRDIPQPHISNGELTLPLNPAKFDSLLDGDHEVDINIYEENRDLFTAHEGKIWTPRKVGEAHLLCADGREARFEVKSQSLEMDYDDANQPIKIEKVGGALEFLYYQLITFGKQLA